MSTENLLRLLTIKEQQTAALNKIAALKVKQAVPALCSLLFKESTTLALKKAVVDTLVSLDGFASIPIIEQALKELATTIEQAPEFEVKGKEYIASLLNHVVDLGASELIYLVIPWLSSMQKELRQTALDCLEQFEWEGQHIQHKIRYFIARDLWGPIQKMGIQLVRPSIALLRTKPLYGVQKLARLLAETGDKRALSPVLFWLFQPAFIVHHPIQLEALVPSFTPLFGPFCKQILQAALFIDRISFSNTTQISYQYSLNTGTKAILKLKETEDLMAQKALKFVHLKKSIALIAVQPNGGVPEYQNFSFEDLPQ